VVERSPTSRLAGQAIDVRGPALDVVDRMGLLAELRQAGTQMRGMSMVDDDGKEIERTTDWTFSTGRLDTGDVEVLREDLTGLLHGRARDGIEYAFDDSITAIDEDQDGLRVGFERGEPRTFDLVVGADGLHSKVRELAFGPESQLVHHLGSYLSVCTAENFLDLDNWQIWHWGTGVGYGVYPVHGNAELRITLNFDSGPLDYDHRDTEQHKTLVADRLSRVRGYAPRLLEAMWKSADFYFDAMAQVRMDRWSAGRVVLLGDAGYCPSPMTGQGTSVALVGAYVLADELRKADGDHAAAFARYEERMRTYVQLNQALALENPGGPPSEETFERARTAMSLDG
jgi:2-polyprenyl-6-methoxyphenol hydroxylase-like FAD-dependent oxidoreductase